MGSDQTQRDKLHVQIRWLIRRDMPEVLNIEKGCFRNIWTENDFLNCLRQRNCIGMVAEHNHEIVGFMIYELNKSRLKVLNFAVDPRFQRQSVGSQMVSRLVDKLSQQRRYEILLHVRESNLSAQLFFAHQGFRAVQVIRSYYEDTAEDAYLMLYQLMDEEGHLLPFVPKNRLTEWLDEDAA